ncbi:hypothetical protein LCGC14_0592750 [marine sediment metagenome]|uniref:Uncharacterized protein n=1 Tax=marine sediment metagenome TaxID=412755 RepID=A0A0F9RWQ6_9ZZZZ
MAKPLTLLESVLVQILIHNIDSDLSNDYVVKVLMRTGLTKQQANKAVGR